MCTNALWRRLEHNNSSFSWRTGKLLLWVRQKKKGKQFEMIPCGLKRKPNSTVDQKWQQNKIFFSCFLFWVCFSGLLPTLKISTNTVRSASSSSLMLSSFTADLLQEKMSMTMYLIHSITNDMIITIQQRCIFGTDQMRKSRQKSVKCVALQEIRFNILMCNLVSNS